MDLLLIAALKIYRNSDFKSWKTISVQPSLNEWKVDKKISNLKRNFEEQKVPFVGKIVEKYFKLSSSGYKSMNFIKGKF